MPRPAPAPPKRTTIPRTQPTPELSRSRRRSVLAPSATRAAAGSRRTPRRRASGRSQSVAIIRWSPPNRERSRERRRRGEVWHLALRHGSAMRLRAPGLRNGGSGAGRVSARRGCQPRASPCNRMRRHRVSHASCAWRHPTIACAIGGAGYDEPESRVARAPPAGFAPGAPAAPRRRPLPSDRGGRRKVSADHPRGSAPPEGPRLPNPPLGGS